MLRTLFQWFDAHPDSYWAILAVPSVVWLGLTLVSARNPDKHKYSRGNEIAFALLLLATLVAWRWPHWLNADPYNPDESQFIAGAITLTKDPIFWRSVDGTTSGPLNFYALLPLHGFGAPLDYFMARVTGLLLVWVAILACYRLVRSAYGATPGRLAILPITAFFAAATDADFIHYSSEHVPLALIAISARCLFEPRSPNQKRWLFLLGGFVAGMLPWAKLQTGPIGATLVVIGLWRLLKDASSPVATRRRLALELIVAAALPALVILAVVGAAGHAGDLYRDYLLQNFSYMDQDWVFGSAVRQLWKFSLETANLPAYVVVTLGGVALAAVLAKTFSKPSFLFVGLLTVVAIFCVFAPKRPSLHYTLLAVVPLTIWFGVSIGELWQLGARLSRWRFLPAGVAVLGMLAIIAVRIEEGAPKMFGHFADHWRQPRSAAGNIVRALTNSNDRLAVWGWMDRMYVESGLAQATHESETFEQIAPSRQQDHYRERYVSDLRRNRPAVFIDATGPGAPYFSDRDTAGHEIVPALAEFIRDHYQLLTDLGYARIYVQRERLAARPIGTQELWRMITHARRDPDNRGPVSVQPKQLPSRKLHGRLVQMMLPPAEMVWELEGTEREIWLEYGFDPKAYTEGKSNGAEVIAELQIPGSPRQAIFHRAIDPGKRVEDRGNLVSRIVLPPFPLGTKFIVRTTPGEFSDNAWDWIYVGPLDRVPAPFYSPNQFPGFSRIPNRFESQYASILEEKTETLLMMHPPAVMQFSLQGNERRWQFDYGFQLGAYTGEGRTDGATFTVELKRENQSAIALFSRTLDPAHVSVDQGRLHTDVILPPIQPGDQLLMYIHPGASLGWDWTYITAVRAHEDPR